MARYRNQLPQLTSNLFLADGGIETTLIFLDGLELPLFASFVLLKTDQGRDALRKYFRSYATVAQKAGVGVVLESATWRASPAWAEKLGYSTAELVDANRQAVAMLTDIRKEFENERTKVVISGCVGPSGDGYSPESWMTEGDAERYHRLQAETFRDSDADLITAITMTHAPEAIGVTRAAQSVGLPVVISFTVETDGRLPTGQPLGEAIDQVDAVTGKGPAYYMINCAHPTHFDATLSGGTAWVKRLGGLRANASSKSHKELDEATELDIGNPAELGKQYRALRDRHPSLRVVGGCCGTDPRHIEAICKACLN